MILNLSEGYETRIGERNNQLSGGQSQRVALARCLYGKPVLSILDEPDANLDIEGMAALEQSIVQMKNNGSTVILITHNVRLLRHADKAMLLANGNIAFLGHPNELMDRLNPRKKA
jgi:ABC-type protease/lipase transport system fused ATPase/permease subunit